MTSNQRFPCRQGCRNPGGIYPSNNFAASTPIIWLRSTSASPPIIWPWSASESLEVGLQHFHSETFFWSSLEFGEKNSCNFGEDLFFWSSLNLLTWKKSWSRFIPPPMLKIGQNWGKIANYSPNAQQRSAPLHVGIKLQVFVLFPLFFIVFINWFDKCSKADMCATIGNCKISCLLFAGDLILLPQNLTSSAH